MFACLKMLMVMVICCVVTTAAEAKGYLAPADIERVKAVKALLEDVDTKSLEQTVSELEKMPNPRLNLAMKEAMAKTYVDIVKDQKIESAQTKAWLYSMVTLNMAYLQFGGSQSAEPLNRLICQKLKMYLPPGTVNQPGFHHSID